MFKVGTFYDDIVKAEFEKFSEALEWCERNFEFGIEIVFTIGDVDFYVNIDNDVMYNRDFGVVMENTKTGRKSTNVITFDTMMVITGESLFY